MTECLCCSQPLLRCIRENKIYWFCPDCRQEMPDLESLLKEQQNKENIAKLNRIYEGEDVVLKTTS
jgi:hypothetical protein